MSVCPSTAEPLPTHLRAWRRPGEPSPSQLTVRAGPGQYGADVLPLERDNCFREKSGFVRRLRDLLRELAKVEPGDT